MGEIVRYIASTGGTTTLSTDARFRDGDLDTWHVTPVWEEQLDVEDRLSGYGLGHRPLEMRFAVSASSYVNVRGTVAAWRQTFMRDVSLGALGTVVVVHNSGTYSIPVAHVTPSIEGPNNQYMGVTLKYQTPSPFWTFGTEMVWASTFAGTASVNVAFTNAGDFRSPAIHVVTGVVGTPVFTLGSKVLTVGTATAGAADQLWIWAAEPLIRYYAGGTNAGDKDSGANWTCHAGIDSTFWDVTAGTGIATIAAASGVATYQLRHDIRKAGIG